MRGGMPVMPLKQPRCGMDQERDEHPVGLGDIKRPLKGTPGGGSVPERVARDRLEQGGRHHPHGMGPDGAAQHGREHGRRAQRIVLGQPQQRDGVAHLAARAFG